MLLVYLFLIHFLRKIETAFRARDVRCDQQHGRSVTVAFVDTVDEVKRALNGVFQSLERNKPLEDIRKLPDRWKKVISLQGNYIEGL